MGATTKKSDKTLSKYWTLIKKFPLCPITNEKQHKQAVALVKESAKNAAHRSTDEINYLSVLVRLIADYESTLPEVQELFRRVNQVTPAEALQFLLEENNLTQTQLALETGLDQGNLSAFLAGRRKLSSAAALKLSKRFTLSAEFFLGQR
jgi:antitoxin component HigA of HigAB toxin-antitoxin module